MFVLENNKVLSQMITNKGSSVSGMSVEAPVMVIFLRHLGCMFCKEALSDLKKIKDEIRKNGTKLVFVHMAEKEIADSFFKAYKFEEVAHVADKESTFYKEFGLSKGDFKQLFGFKSWFGMGRAASKGNFPSAQVGDAQQMPGIFLIHKDEVVKSYIYKSVGDYPDYIQMSSLS